MPLQPIRKQEIRCIYCGSATGSIIEKIPAILDFPAENSCVQLFRTNDFLKLPSNFSHHFILSCVVSSVVNHGEIKMLDLIVIWRTCLRQGFVTFLFSPHFNLKVVISN